MGRARGGQRSCWTNSADCNVQLLHNPGDGSVPQNRPTARWSDAAINSLRYSLIRWQGTGQIMENVFWRGKNAAGGGCTCKDLDTLCTRNPESLTRSRWLWHRFVDLQPHPHPPPTRHQCQRNGWLTRSRFPAVALAPSQIVTGRGRVVTATAPRTESTWAAGAVARRIILIMVGRACQMLCCVFSPFFGGCACSWSEAPSTMGSTPSHHGLPGQIRRPTEHQGAPYSRVEVEVLWLS